MVDQYNSRVYAKISKKLKLNYTLKKSYNQENN